MLSSSSSSSLSCFALFTLICILTDFTYEATVLPSDEVEALKDIGKKLGKVWNFSVDPCGGQHGWRTSRDDAINCNCSYLNNTVCHVVNIVLRHQYLQGTLPLELIRLPYLREFKVTSNYLKGTIPEEWGLMQNLQLVSLARNLLSGAIPKELGNIITLTSFSVEANQLSGVLPPQLGNLHNLQRVFLNSNNFTGDLPPTFANLTSLRDLWLSDNQFIGKIPDFIGNWTNIGRLVMEGSGLQGPIPSSIEALKNLSELRITDLKGPEGPFPRLGNLSMKTVILRSCNLIGELPDYVGQMTNLQTLDVSFNKLKGKLPSSLENLPGGTYKYLTGNLFTGPIPYWILNKAENIDLSYNNFTTEGSTCGIRSVNLFASSSKGNHLGVSCLANLQCPESLYSLHINCGGREITIDKIAYNEDKDDALPTKFFYSKYKWAYSSTGHFLDGAHPYIWSNKSTLTMENPELYMTARLSPLSLTYYGYCLMNGNYTVQLHFAEIIFTVDGNYTSLGRRIFDVYIQGKRMLKDFNIAREAGGCGKKIIKNFTVPVTDSTLEIRLYWAGKGTISFPKRSFYGPLISAISVNKAGYVVPQRRPKGTKISSYAIVVIISAVVFVILLILGTYYGRRCLRGRGTSEEDLKGIDVQISSFTLRQMKNATNNFAASNKIGEGGFGPVYKGILSSGTVVAVKQLSSNSRQGSREFLNELGIISALEHPHLVKLYGCCVEENQLLLVYEYMENNSLAHALFGPENILNLDWSIRQRICLGVAKGLAYLHEESRLKIIHRDIKSTNVLLDKNLNPKISDFGLAKLNEEDKTHISTRIAGTHGYMAPEYAMKGYLTDKADVYSFGIVALEIVSGRRNTASEDKIGCFGLLDWARELKRKDTLLELVDPRLGSNFKEEDVIIMINVGLLCTEVSLASRPAMSSVVRMLEGKIAVPSSVSVEPFEDVLSSETMTKSMSTGGSQMVSSTIQNDLSPLIWDSDVLRHSE